MVAFWSGSSTCFAQLSGAQITAQLAHASSREMHGAWRYSIPILQTALSALAPQDWHVLLDIPLLRLGRRIDAVLLTDRAVLVLEFSRAEAGATALRQVEDYALDLFEFHAGTRGHPVIPILVSEGAAPLLSQAFLPLAGVAPPRQCGPEALAAEIRTVLAAIPVPAAPLRPQSWCAAAYRPVPGIIEAAVTIYSRNGVADIAASRADAPNLRETTAAIGSILAAHRHAGTKIIIFVTGIPGAGKTLCGLNAAFAAPDATGGIFLTGNPTLMHVLREALARDAIAQGGDKRVARRRMESIIQALPRFRNHYLAHGQDAPAETLLVIDEAQRCWSRDYAMRKTRDTPYPLTDSEPGHLLDIAARHAGFAGILCLIGSGQEIHDGEGGLAEWGAALARRPAWHVAAAPDAADAGDARWRLGALPAPHITAALHLDVPVRQIRARHAASWVDALLRGDIEAARAIAREAPPPYFLTRDAAELRAALRACARGHRRCGLLASSGGRRLRAEGLGAELPHMDAGAVAHWFLDHYPADIRASDALEQVATEFSCQGLELDYTGLCWDADLMRNGPGAWQPRRLAGTAWQTMRAPEQIANQINTYRVLLTRARYETIIYVPRGDAGDPTRKPGIYDEIAAYLSACGVACLPEPEPAPIPPAKPRAADLLAGLP